MFPAQEDASFVVVAVPAFERIEEGKFEGGLVVLVLFLYGDDCSFNSPG